MRERTVSLRKMLLAAVVVAAGLYFAFGLDRTLSLEGLASQQAAIETWRAANPLVGEHAGDLIGEYVLAMKQGIGLNRILDTIHVYPTLAEANRSAAGALKQAHAPQKLLEWLGRYHAWRRG